ncbi:DUF397 domain-containing protein [Streptomyces abikoensis]|uniref:DUF397 domain-containing protein n=1 Tax=Streptomyces abikoensis TaxID=97398 RepID=UPI0019C2F382|nr:DUF397 domain-containing protein [Streptomyces abikoensis]GGP66679.1 hypothetical protein GCM10010214_46130 [Streptomyces abikoensis]
MREEVAVVGRAMTPDGIWRKSSYSSGNGQCFEIAVWQGAVATRDSKNLTGSSLIFAVGAWSAFLAGLRAGGFGAAG